MIGHDRILPMRASRLSARALSAARQSPVKLTDQLVQDAGRLYATGLSLENVAAHFNVNESTIRNEFTLAGIQVRARRGWNN